MSASKQSLRCAKCKQKACTNGASCRFHLRNQCKVCHCNTPAEELVNVYRTLNEEDKELKRTGKFNKHVCSCVGKENCQAYFTGSRFAHKDVEGNTKCCNRLHIPAEGPLRVAWFMAGLPQVPETEFDAKQGFTQLKAETALEDSQRQVATELEKARAQAEEAKADTVRVKAEADALKCELAQTTTTQVVHIPVPVVPTPNGFVQAYPLPQPLERCRFCLAGRCNPNLQNPLYLHYL